ncbi:MAG: DUF3795 domain-containing protein [Candidatus Lokiarchaeota archaeon]|nr:DUF3795 domain-containing protein [Candidatus Lokiarchaeota archaeon]MBD3340809.1 DUF3795 domain-containing protein [Candidatus Lokiarchaeota archaeon]
MTSVKKELLAPCGLYCGVCSIYIAHRDNNLKFKNALMKVYKLFVKGVDDIACTGCLSEGIVFPVCKACPIKDCVRQKGIEGCHQCSDFPCKFIENFPLEVGKKVILRAIPMWRELGSEKWVELEEERYHCPNCNNPLFRGAKRCNKCGIPVDVD